MRAYLFAGQMQQRDDALLDLLHGEGFGEEAVCARGHCLDQPGIAGVGGNQEQRDARRKVAALLVQQEIESVHPGHVQVAEDEGEGLIGGGGAYERIQTLPAIGHVQDFGETGKDAAKRALQDAAHGWGIVDDQDPYAHAREEASEGLSAGWE